MKSLIIQGVSLFLGGTICIVLVGQLGSNLSYFWHDVLLLLGGLLVSPSSGSLYDLLRGRKQTPPNWEQKEE